ncbi:hypothetical protein [Corynebacterium variabile]|uniref:hypothetical protein n=1 Tax=Corynebacterium variabile TaxID=1727 RepID=UPI003FD3F9B3
MRNSDLQARFDVAWERVQEWRSVLLRIDKGVLPGVEEDSFLGAEIKGAAAVATMAELESLIKNVIINIGENINSDNIEIRNLIPSLRPLAVESMFTSITESPKKPGVWNKKIALTSLESSTEAARLPGPMRKGPQPPLSGRTIENSQLDTLWKVFSFDYDPLPQSQTGHLIKLTGLRNDIAHANSPIWEIFMAPGRMASDLARYLDGVAYLLTCLSVTWADYIANKRYMVRVV